MRNRKGYTRTAIPDLIGVTEALVSDKFPHLGVADAVDDPGFYYLFHLPSHRLACIVEGQDKVLEAVTLLGAVPGLEQPDPPKVALDTALAILRGWKPEKKVKKAPPPPEPAVVWEPVYNPGVTPSAAVRAADRTLASILTRAAVEDAEFVKGAIDRAIALAWREALVAAVDQVLASDDEIPQAPIRLQDGTLCSWEGFRESYKRLIRIGNELQMRAVEFLDYHDQGMPGLQREWLRNWEEDWIGLVTEGWMEWTACVSHFLASPEIRQEQVRQKLGYIGTRERGWGALGRKTFLRHPEIAEASKARRLVRYEREAKRGG